MQAVIRQANRPHRPGIGQQSEKRARGNERQRQTLRLQLPQSEERRQPRGRNKGPTDPEEPSERIADNPDDCYPPPGSPRPAFNTRSVAPCVVGDGRGNRGEKKSEGKPQDMRVEAGRQTGCRIGRNQSRPGDGRRHAQIDAEASPIARKGPRATLGTTIIRTVPCAVC
jgi:hypothetical protein